MQVIWAHPLVSSGYSPLTLGELSFSFPFVTSQRTSSIYGIGLYLSPPDTFCGLCRLAHSSVAFAKIFLCRSLIHGPEPVTGCFLPGFRLTASKHTLCPLDRMQKMQFSKWGDSGSVEGKSGLTGQRANLPLQRVHMSVSILTFKTGIERFPLQL